jgi:hypothetical protein
MEKKQIPAQLSYCAEKMLTASEISGFAEEVMQKMYSDLEAAAIAVTGPPQFHYFNVDPSGEKPFQLLIALPVAEQKQVDPVSSFFYLQSEPFTCLTEDYAGTMEDLGDAWVSLVGKVIDEGYLPQNQCREVYKVWISFDSPENLTELQMGIAAKRR